MKLFTKAIKIMCVYDKTLGMSSQLSTCKEVYVNTSEGKVDKSFTPTFRSFYDSLSNEGVKWEFLK